MIKVRPACCVSCGVSPNVGQDRIPLLEPYQNLNRNVPSNDNILIAGNNQETDAGMTVIRIRVEHGIQVAFNSLVAPAVTSFFHDMVVNVSRLFLLHEPRLTEF